MIIAIPIRDIALVSLLVLLLTILTLIPDGVIGIGVGVAAAALRLQAYEARRAVPRWRYGAGRASPPSAPAWRFGGLSKAGSK